MSNPSVLLSVWEYVTGQRRPLCVERAVRETLPAVTHTHTQTAISHYTTQAMKQHVCVCVCMWLNAKALIERRERVIYGERQCRSSLLLPPSFSPRYSSAHSLCSIIHTSQSSIHQNVHSIIITIITIYQIISASSKNYSSYSCMRTVVSQLCCYKISLSGLEIQIYCFTHLSFQCSGHDAFWQDFFLSPSNRECWLSSICVLYRIAAVQRERLELRFRSGESPIVLCSGLLTLLLTANRKRQQRLGRNQTDLGGEVLCVCMCV